MFLITKCFQVFWPKIGFCRNSFFSMISNYNIQRKTRLVFHVLLLLFLFSPAFIDAAERSTMKMLVNNSQAQRIFDANATTMLIGWNADYGPSESDKRAAFDLWRVNIPAKTAILVKTTERVIEAFLSPVDDRIAYITESYLLWVADSSAKNPLKLYEGAVSGCAWSPDGAKIAFAAEDASPLANPDIFVAETKKNGLVTQLTSHISDDDIPVWSPDGRHILFVSGRMGIASLWMMQADGNDLRQITNHGLVQKQGKAPEGFIPVPVFNNAIVWPEQGKLYFHSGDELWELQADQATTDRSLVLAKSIMAKKLKTTEFPVGLFTINQELTLWLNEENTVNIMNVEQ